MSDDKAMTLEHVASDFRAYAADGGASLSRGDLLLIADAIDAEIKARGEPVFFAWPPAIKAADTGVRAQTEVCTVAEGTRNAPLYTAPPAPKIEVTDAMVERALNAMFVRDVEGQGFCWQDAVGDPRQTEADMRAALEAALKEMP